MTPSDTSPWIASRTDVRATRNCSDNARSDGMRAPGCSSPVEIRSYSYSRMRPLSVSRPIGSNTMVGSMADTAAMVSAGRGMTVLMADGLTN
jgi:hypothetical protein